MTTLQLRLFGPLEVTAGLELVSGFDSDKVRALLAYLAVEADRPHRREKLAGLLWPDYPESSARTSLRRALSNLRQVIGDRDADPPYLLITRQTIQFNAHSQAWVDVTRFSALIQGGDDQRPAAAELEEAIDLARGSFLEGFSLPDSSAFEDWQRLTAESLQQQVLGALHRLADYYEDLGQYEKALTFARRQLELEPYQEGAHQQAMRILYFSGRRGEALSQFAVLEETLAAELEMAPSAESVALYNRIQSGDETQPPVDRPNAVRGYEVQELLGSGYFGAVYRAHQPVIGRDVAVKIILPQYADDPDFIRRFAVEAQLVARLEHPHIVPLYDYWREPGGAFLVMRWLRGGSLKQALRRGPWRLTLAVQVLQQIASALHFAHAQGIIHRDIKPANILLDDSSNAYLSDFGVATLVGPWDAISSDSSANGSTTSGSLGYLSPEGIQAGAVSAASDIYSLGVVIYELLSAQHPFPGCHGQELLDKHLHEPFPEIRLLRPELPPAVDAVIQRAADKDPLKRYASAQELADALGEAAAASDLPKTPPVRPSAIHNPYKGLRAFQEADAADFFGRSALIERLLARMEEASTSSSFLALVGPSGSGKSSVIAAGLLPALRQGALPGSDDWFIAQMVPGRHPLDELEIALLRIAVGQPSGLAEQLRRDERGLIRAASLALPEQDSQLTLIIDQFEEIFTLAADPEESARFLKLLVTAAAEPRSQVRILISMRADFYDRPLMHVDLGRLMRLRTEVVVPMDAEEMSQAIVEPAVRAGVELEPELLTTMVADLGQEPGALPLLQYALTELFDQRENERLTLAAYHEMGGVLGALGRRAEEIYLGLDKTEQSAARQLFLQLAALGEGTEDTRRRVLLANLETLAPDPGTDQDGSASPSPVDSVLKNFGQYRLLSFDRDPATRSPNVEVAHEALFRQWARLQQWLDESRDDIRQERALSRAAEEWHQHDRDESFLLRGSRLDQALEWRATSTLVQTALVKAFISQSSLQRDIRRRAEEERAAREARLERTRRTLTRGLIVVLSIGLVVALALTYFAFSQRNDAEQSEALAQAESGARATAEMEALGEAAARATAQSEAEGEAQARATAQALAEGEAQARATAQVEAEDQRQSALDSAAEAQNVALVAGSQAAFANNDMDTALTLAWQAVALNPDSALAQAQLSEVAYAPGTVRLLQGNEAYINRLYVSPDSKTVFAVGVDGVVILWDLDTGQILWQAQAFTSEELSEAEEAIKVEGNDGGFSPDGQIVAAAYDDRIMFWNAADGQLVRRVDSTALDQKVEFNPTGDQFVTIGKEDQGRLVFWDFASGEIVREFERGSNIEEVTFTADGTAILLASQVGELTLLDSLTGDIIYEVQEDLGTNAGPLFFIDISPDGTQLIANFSNAGVLIWDLATGSLLHDFRYEGGIFSTAFHPNDGTVITTAQGGIKIIDPQTGAVLNSLHSPAVIVLALSPDGRRVVTSSLDGTVRLWDLQRGQVVRRYPTAEALLFEITLSPDGQTVLVGSTDGSATLWDLESGQEIWRVEDDQPILAVAFSPDGRQALTGGGFRLAQRVESGHIILWDVETGQEIRRFEGHPYAVFDVAFSPDGQLVASAGNGAIAILWDFETGQEIRRFEDYWEDYIYLDNSYWSVEFSPDGQQLFASHSGGSIIRWDVESGQQIQQMKGHVQGGKIAFDEDGQRLVSGSADSQAILWDVPTGTILQRFVDHGSGVGSVRFSPDEAQLLGGSEDGITSLWQVETGEEIRRYGGGYVFSPNFGPDEQHAVVGYRDGAVELWRIDTTLDELLTWTRNNRYIPELTCEQRALYGIAPLCE